MVFWKHLRDMHNTDGLYCTMLSGDNLGCNGNHYTFGAAADSAYEYMLKQWILTGGKDTVSCRYLNFLAPCHALVPFCRLVL